MSTKYYFVLDLNKFSVKMAENSENVILEPSSEDKVVDEKVEETTDEKILEEALDGGGAEADTNETGKMSSKSSDISIEEIGFFLIIFDLGKYVLDVFLTGGRQFFVILHP